MLYLSIITASVIAIMICINNSNRRRILKEKYNLSVITTLAMLCTAISGCGDSGQNTSSTNDTEQREAEKFDSAQYNPDYYNGIQNRASKNTQWLSRYDWFTNNRPIADISGTHTFFSGETVTLDGSGSYDEDGDELIFYWRQTQGPQIALDNRYGDTLTFIVPEVSEPTQFDFFLIVYDGMLADLAGFSLQVSPVSENTPPSITQRYPLPDQTDVATDTEISVTFNEAISENSIDATSLILSNSGSLIPGNVSYDDVSHSITFSPNAELDEGTKYIVTLGDNILDVAGNLVPSESWEFVTTGGNDSADDGADDNPDDVDDNPDDNATYNLGPTTQQTIDECMDEADKQMLTLVNNARAQTRSCGSMSYQAAPAVGWNCRLESAAYGHSVSMAENNYFSHTGRDGSNPGDRISAAGYDWTTYGENIAAGYSDAETVMDGWLTSAGHCANLMNSSFKDIGVGVANGNGSYGIYWTQVFAAQ
jgi:uncharacterized protein YkwD